MPESQNENCLVGWQCPECGHAASFKVAVVCHQTVWLYDSGTEVADVHGTDWQDDSDVTCGDCGHAGVVSDFVTEQRVSAAGGDTIMRLGVMDGLQPKPIEDA